MARETKSEVEADRERLRRRRNYWEQRCRDLESFAEKRQGERSEMPTYKTLATWSVPFGFVALTCILALITILLTQKPQPIEITMPSAKSAERPAPVAGTMPDHRSHPSPVSIKVVGSKPQVTSGLYKVTKVSPQRVLASVRVGKYGGCSGTIIKIEGKTAWGVSAAHCASNVGDQFTIGLPTGGESQARWIAIDRGVDLSLFIAWAVDGMGSAKVCSSSLPDWSKDVEAIGYPGGSGPKWKRFKYYRTEGHGQAGSRRYFNSRYLFRNLGPGVFAGGDSGGGVFYDGDHFIGVMTHGGPHAASLPQIQKFLTQNEKLFEGNSPFS